MNLWGPYTKAMLTNRTLWFWAVVFMGFWLAIGAFVESQGLSLVGASLRNYATSWYAVIVLFSLSMLAISIANSMTYGSGALAYSFRFTRLTPESYFGSVVGGSAVLGIVLSFVLIGATTAMFAIRFGSVLLPADVPALLGISLLGGVFYMALSMTLILVVINYLGLKSASFIGFVPLLFSYALGIAQAYVRLPDWLLYGSPFNDIASLLYQGFAGYPSAAVLGEANAAPLDWAPLTAGIVVWTLLLTGTSLLLLRRIRARQLEEGRQI